MQVFKRSIQVGILVVLVFGIIFVVGRKIKMDQAKKNNVLVDLSFYDNIDFSLVKVSDFLDAVSIAVEQNRKQIEKIVSNPQPPSFLNTVVALDQSGLLLSRIVEVFFHLTHADFVSQMEEVEEKISVKLSELDDEILYNDKLFSRIKAVYDSKDSLYLSKVEQRLLETTYNRFYKNGSTLSRNEKEELKQINQSLTSLTTKFSQNLIKESASSFILIDEKDKDRLKGVSEEDIESFHQDALRHNKTGYLLSYINPRVRQILKFGSDRSLRQEVWEFYQKQGRDINSDIVLSVMKLRARKAEILGFSNYADYILKDNSMAGSLDEAQGLLESILPKSLSAMKKDALKLEELARSSQKDPNFELNIWDWAYYTQILKEKKYSYNENELKQFFELYSVRDGVFNAIQKLYGISFKKREDIPLYHHDEFGGIDTYEVFDKDQSPLGILYLDYFAREGKKSGAWSTSIKSKRGQLDESGKLTGYELPVEVVVFNFPNPSSQGTLLSLDDTTTFFHEMGHAVNSFLIEPVYVSLSESFRDFVELPSQLFEHWATDPAYLPLFARHYKTEQAIEAGLVQKIQESLTFDRGYFVSRQLFLGLEDLGWHSLTTSKINQYESASSFEEEYLKELGLESRYDFVPRSYRFSHIISTGYDARYYSYMWSDMLVEDAFEEFKKEGLFNQKVSSSFKENILTNANSKDPMKAYIKFKGKAPSVEGLLRKEGFIK